jgi:molecular chaperone GrpE
MSEKMKEEKKVEAANETNLKKEVNNKEEQKKGLFNKKEDPQKIKLEKENKKLKDENNVLNDKVLRISAEMQNMMRRNEEKVQNLLKYEGEDLIKKLLPTLDNFERAISMDDTNLLDEVSKFLSGFKMIYGNLSDVLKSYEVEVIDCLHKPFDPNTMEAVLVEEAPGIEPNMVIDVLQKGYTYKGKVIRHAMVKVSK